MSKPYPHDEHIRQVRYKDPKTQLKNADGAIPEKDQFRVSAIIHRCDELGHAARPVIDLLLR